MTLTAKGRTWALATAATFAALIGAVAAIALTGPDLHTLDVTVSNCLAAAAKAHPDTTYRLDRTEINGNHGFVVVSVAGPGGPYGSYSEAQAWHLGADGWTRDGLPC